MEKCRRLEEYAIFVDRVRGRLAESLPLAEAIMAAIDDCIRDGVLRDILIQQKAEVVQMILETFDKDKYEKAIKNEAYEDGYTEGRKEGYDLRLLEQVQKKLARGKSAEEIAQDLEETPETIAGLISRLQEK